MASVLSSFFARDPKSQFAFDIPSTAAITHNGISIGDSFKKAEPEELATVFWSTATDFHLKTQAQKLKTMRHPNIVTFLDSLEADNSFYLVTERCLPLHSYLARMKFTEDQKEFVVSWGLFQIMSGLKFLHEANLSHESIRTSIYVTAGGDWKIAGLDKVSAFSTAKTDLNQLAFVMWEVFNGISKEQKPSPPLKIPKKLHDLYKRMATDAATRLSVAELIRECRMTGGFFKNKFVDTLLFLEEFQLKEANEKQTFFMHLRENLDIFPDDIAKYKILPKLVQSYEYGDAGPNILIPLFKLGRLLDEEEYQKRIVPCLVKLFGSPDRTTRVKLLERIDEFAPHLTAQVINEKIFTNLVSGFLDTSPAVRESTVKAMVSLAEKLNFHNLNNELMKYLARLQGGDEQGGIRTNTTICLGKIGSFLDPSKRQTILLSAFTRGMKDPFPPARMAAVLALSATQQFYTLVECANRILPALAPLTCDPEKQVRDQAFKSIKGFMENLEKASENPELIPEIEAQVKAGGRSLLSSDKVPQWASWALKSLSGKFYKGTPPAENTAKAASGDGRGATPEPGSGSARTSTASGAAAARTAPKSTAEGWGELDDDGWEDKDEDKDEWADAKEPAASNDDDDWSGGWETAAKPVKVDLKKPVAKPASKVTVTKSKPADMDAKLAFGASEKKSASSSSGWDDFDTDAGAKTTSGGGGGWDDDGWGDTTTKTTLTTSTNNLNKEKEARRAEMAARNEARKAEQAARKAKGGALKLNAVPKQLPKEEDFADW